MGISSLVLPLFTPSSCCRTQLNFKSCNNIHYNSSSSYISSTRRFVPCKSKYTFRRRALPETTDDDGEIQGTNTATIISACLVGLVTGISVVIFNNLVIYSPFPLSKLSFLVSLLSFTILQAPMTESRT